MPSAVIGAHTLVAVVDHFSILAIFEGTPEISIQSLEVFLPLIVNNYLDPSMDDKKGCPTSADSLFLFKGIVFLKH